MMTIDRLAGFIPLLITFLGITTAEDPYLFINPPPPENNANYANNPVYTLGSILEIQWHPPDVSDYVSMVLYQRRPGVEFEYVFQNVGGLTSYRWQIETFRDIDITPVFFLQIFEKGISYPATRSHYFNLTKPASSSTIAATTGRSTTKGERTSTTSAIALSTTTTSTTIAATPLTSSSSSLSSGHGLNTGAKAGIGVGAAVAGLIVLAAAVFFVLRRRRGRVAESQVINIPPDTPKFAGLPTPAPNLESSFMPELPAASARPVELPT